MSSFAGTITVDRVHRVLAAAKALNIKVELIVEPPCFDSFYIYIPEGHYKTFRNLVYDI